MSSPGPASVNAGIKVGRGQMAFMPEQLANELVRSRVGVEHDLSCQMPELMRVHFHAEMSGKCFLNRDCDRVRMFWITCQIHKDPIWTLAR